MVSHAALLVAVHAHPPAVVTLILAAPPLLPGDALVGDTEYVHGAIHSKVFDRALGEVPPGPIADTVESYTIPDEGSAAPKSVAKLTLIVLLASGVGFPSASV